MKNNTIAYEKAGFTDYLKLARIDHWFKNIFMLPGLVFAFMYFNPVIEAGTIFKIIAGIFSTCLVASANYVINEWLDAEFDRYHPVKKHRPSVTKSLNETTVYIQYFAIAITGLAISWSISMNFFLISLFLLVMGLVYNVKPARSKDRIYMDVISESVNNPIRFMLGWLLLSPAVMPPSSILLAYWMGGAFLMGSKRFAEYRFIDNKEQASLYRKSFGKYTEQSLLISTFFYALTSAFFLGIFLIKHRIELLLTFPFFALMFAWYMHIAFSKDSAAQRPEQLYKNTSFMVYIVFMSVLFMALLFVDIPWLNVFLQNNFG